MSIETIYETLRSAGLTHAGACGLMGNMKAESGMKANIAQRGMTAMSDEQYTAAADAGTISFEYDSVGYGLCQWTFWSRKAGLLKFARAYGVSVGDEAMQVSYCIRELTEEYPSVWRILTTGTDIDACSDIVCTQFERPAVNNLEQRRSYAREFDLRFRGAPDPSAVAQAPAAPLPGTQDDEQDIPQDPSILMLQAILCYNGYETPITGLRSRAFYEKLREFTDDVIRMGGG